MGQPVKGKLLLVDDESDVLNALTGLFEQEGYEIRTARSAYESALLMGGAWVPDLIILDWKLSSIRPGKDGLNLLNHFWKDCEHSTPIIMFSGYVGTPEFETAKSSLEKKCDKLVYKCIQKPGCKELVGTVKQFFEER